MKFVRTDAELSCPTLDQQLLEDGHQLILISEQTPQTTFLEEMADCDVLLMCYRPIDHTVIDASPNLKTIIKYGVGIDAIDITYANSKGIAVVNIPEYAERTVAEGAFCMMLALLKKLPFILKEMQNKAWLWPQKQNLASDVFGKTLGIIGCGKIGTSMAQMASAGFGMHVLAYDPYKSKDELKKLGIHKVDQIEELLPQVDVLSLHAVLNKETYHIIGEKELSLLKPSAILINSARGALVDEKALIYFLEQSKIAAAGLDVFTNEPLNKSLHPLKKLYQLDNVLIFPHLTFYTEEAMQRLERECLERCYEVTQSLPLIIKSKDSRLLDQQNYTLKQTLKFV